MSLLKSEWRGNHAVVVYRAAPYCGESWCEGRCGIPALVVPSEGVRAERRIFGGMVACGPAAQPFRLPWVGDKVSAHAEDWEHLLQTTWW